MAGKNQGEAHYGLVQALDRLRLLARPGRPAPQPSDSFSTHPRSTLARMLSGFLLSTRSTSRAARVHSRRLAGSKQLPASSSPAAA